MKKKVFVDMDGVLVDFQSGIDRLSEKTKQDYKGHLDDVPGIFSLMEPIPKAIESIKILSEHFDLYVLTTAPWKNTSAWTDKANWIQKYFGSGQDSIFYKRLIITHHKDLNKGDFLIDDRDKWGAKDFCGEWIQFGSEKFPDWERVTKYLINKSKMNKSAESPDKRKNKPWKEMTPEEREVAKRESDELAKALAKEASERMRRGDFAK